MKILLVFLLMKLLILNNTLIYVYNEDVPFFVDTEYTASKWLKTSTQSEDRS